VKASIREKLARLAERAHEVAALLGEPEVIEDPGRFRTLSQEYARLEPLAQAWSGYQDALDDLQAAQSMLEDEDPEMRRLAEDEINRLQARIAELEDELQRLLIPPDPHDQANIYLEIRAGTGGDEAALFAGDLFRMYSRYAEAKGWQVEIINQSAGEHGGFKEVILRLLGRGVYARLKFESGVHRVQRVPVTESQGRIHTSAATVAVLPEVEAIDTIELDPNDLRIDTFRASGAGGQHVNKTDSAIRITHLPTGMVVECQDERSQHKNRARALALLKARLLQREREQRAREQAETRRGLVGSGDRSERIRTYNFPQGRVTDHRINLTLYKLEQILEGELDLIIDPLIREHQAERLAALSEAP